MPAGSEGPETGASLAPLDEAASLPLQEALGSSPFKILYSFVSKTPELAQMLAPALQVHASWKARNPDGEAVGPPVGLKLNVDLGYVAPFGTLMVDATVRSPRLAEDATVKCAVHYVKEGGSFWEFFEDDRMRYTVVPGEACT